MAGVVAVIALIVAVGAAIYASNMAPDDNGGRQLTKQGSQNSRDRVYGTCRVSCTNVFTNVLNRDQSYRMDVFAAAGIGPVIFHNIWIEDKKMFAADKNDLTSPTSSTSGTYTAASMRSPYRQSDAFKMQWRSGQENQVAAHLATSNSDGQFGGSMKGALVPTIVIYADFSDNQEYVIFGDRYQIEALVTAVDIYDPRTGLVDGKSSNPALAIYDFLTSTYFGMGIDPDYIDIGSVMNAANQCDANGLEIHTQIDGSASFSDTLTDMLATFGGSLIIHNGKIQVLFEKKELVSLYSFDETNILENSFSVQPDSSSNYYNVVSATFKAANKSDRLDDYVIPANALDQLSDPNSRIGKDGELITKRLELKFCRDSSFGTVINNVKWLANREYIRSDYQTTCEFDVDLLQFPDLNIWSVVDITHPVYGWTNKKFRVMKMTTSTDAEKFNIATISLSEYNDAIYEGNIDGVGGAGSYDWDKDVAAPLNLLFDLKSYVTDGFGVLSWTATHFNSGVSYDIEYKLSSEIEWTRLAYRHEDDSYDVYNLKVGLYDFRVRTRDPLLGVSEWTVITNQGIGVNYALPELTGLAVDSTGEDFIYSWDSALDVEIENTTDPTDPNSGGATGTVLDVFNYYEITISKGGVNQSVHQVTDPVFIYTYEENKASASGIARDVKASIVIVDKAGTRSAIPSEITGNNPQIAAPTGFGTNNTLETSNMVWDPVEDTDYVATEIHISTVSGFTPNAGTLYKRTSDSSFLYQFPDGTDGRYARIGHYDTFGSDSINYSPEAALIHVPINATYDDTELQGAISDLQLDLTDLNNELQGKFPVQTIDMADLAVTTEKLVDDAITSVKIAMNAVGSQQLSAEAVTAAKLASGAVTGTKIADDAITTPKIIAGAITAAKIGAAAITSDKIAANAITAGKIAAAAIVAENIVSGTITSLEIASQAITADKLAANSVTADKIVANAITADKIAANSITSREISTNTVRAENMYVGAISHINNFSTSTSPEGWTGNWPIEETVTLYGKTVATMNVTTNGDAQVISDAFQVDHDEVYEVNLSIYNSGDATTGARYFGLYAFDADIYDGIDVATAPRLNVNSFDALTLAANGSTNNPYFWFGDIPTNSWYIMKAYIIGANVEVEAIPETFNVNNVFKLTPDTKSACIRFLNYGNAGTTITNHFYNPSVKRVGAGFLRAENIRAGVIRGHSIQSDSLITSPKIHVGDVEGQTGKSIAIDSLADSPIIIRNGSDVMLKFVSVTDSNGSRDVLQLGGGLAPNTISSPDVFTDTLWNLIAGGGDEGGTGGIYKHPSTPVYVSNQGTTNLSTLQIASANANPVEVSYGFSMQDETNSTSGGTGRSVYNIKVYRSVNNGGQALIHNQTHYGATHWDGELKNDIYDLDVSVTFTDSTHGAADTDTIEYILVTSYVSGHHTKTGWGHNPRVNSLAVAQATSGGATTLGGLNDTEFAQIAEGDSIKWDPLKSKWVNGPGGGTIETIEDTEIVLLEDKQILAYDALSEKWKNVDVPSALLNIADNETSGVDVTGNINATGDITAQGGVWGYSDIRLKENIKPLTNSLDRVCRLNGVSFDRKDIKASMAGLIAQEVEDVIPCGVSNEKEFKRIDTNAVIGLLVESIKELKKEIEELKSVKS